jgi:hypothetical protein
MKNVIKKKIVNMPSKMKMMTMQMKICKENNFMSFYAKIDFLGQRLTFC